MSDILLGMTESKALTHSCPVKRVPARAVPAQETMDYCDASLCMMWRWAKIGDSPSNPSLGYCGLAGKDISP